MQQLCNISSYSNTSFSGFTAGHIKNYHSYQCRYITRVIYSTYLHRFHGKSAHLPAMECRTLLALKYTGSKQSLYVYIKEKRYCDVYPFKSFMHERVTSRHFILKNAEPSSYGFPLDKKNKQAYFISCFFFCWDSSVPQPDYEPRQYTAQTAYTSAKILANPRLFNPLEFSVKHPGEQKARCRIQC